MSTDSRSLEIGNMPEVLRLVNKVRKTRTPRILSRGKKPLALLQPLAIYGKRDKKAKSKKDYEAFLASAGTWSDVDTDRLVKGIYESRNLSSRPPVNL